jgi:hypothetical protein
MKFKEIILPLVLTGVVSTQESQAQIQSLPPVLPKECTTSYVDSRGNYMTELREDVPIFAEFSKLGVDVRVFINQQKNSSDTFEFYSDKARMDQEFLSKCTNINQWRANNGNNDLIIIGVFVNTTDPTGVNIYLKNLVNNTSLSTALQKNNKRIALEYMKPHFTKTLKDSSNLSLGFEYKLEQGILLGLKEYLTIVKQFKTPPISIQPAIVIEKPKTQEEISLQNKSVLGWGFASFFVALIAAAGVYYALSSKKDKEIQEKKLNMETEIGQAGNEIDPTQLKYQEVEKQFHDLESDLSVEQIEYCEERLKQISQEISTCINEKKNLNYTSRDTELQIDGIIYTADTIERKLIQLRTKDLVNLESFLHDKAHKFNSLPAYILQVNSKFLDLTHRFQTLETKGYKNPELLSKIQAAYEQLRNEADKVNKGEKQAGYEEAENNIESITIDLAEIESLLSKVEQLTYLSVQSELNTSLNKLAEILKLLKSDFFNESKITFAQSQLLVSQHITASKEVLSKITEIQSENSLNNKLELYNQFVLLKQQVLLITSNLEKDYRSFISRQAALKREFSSLKSKVSGAFSDVEGINNSLDQNTQESKLRSIKSDYDEIERQIDSGELSKANEAISSLNQVASSIISKIESLVREEKREIKEEEERRERRHSNSSSSSSSKPDDDPHESGGTY